MIQIFDATMRGKAQYLGTVKGYIAVWGFAPFWVGQSRQALENLQTPPAGGFNIEVRDGLYISGDAVSTPTSSPTPVWLPWNGDVYVLNGSGALDQATNVAEVTAIPC